MEKVFKQKLYRKKILNLLWSKLLAPLRNISSDCLQNKPLLCNDLPNVISHFKLNASIFQNNKPNIMYCHPGKDKRIKLLN